MTLSKTTELINTCDAAFKRSGLLRLAEHPRGSGHFSGNSSSNQASQPSLDRTNNVPWQNGVGSNAALDLNSQIEVHDPAETYGQDASYGQGASHARTEGLIRSLGISALDAILPGGGLPTGKVIELSLSGGAACGTQLALWACRAAQQQAELNGTDSWSAFIDPTASLHAPGVLSNGVSLPRFLVLRPNLEDVERVALRLSEANVFSVIIIDLVGVPWLPARTAVRSRSMASSSDKRQNWNRTVRQLALRLEHTQAQVIVLTSAESNRSLPLPVALRLHMRADVRGVNLQVVKESQGRVGAQGVVPWSAWENEHGSSIASASNAVETDRAQQLFSRAKTLPLPRYVEPDHQGTSHSQAPVRTSARVARDTEIPIVASSRIARTSRASL